MHFLNRDINSKCECISLQTHVLILSVLDLLGGFALLGLVIQAFYPALVYIWEVEIYYGFLVPFVFAVGAVTLQVLLAVVLFHGTKSNKKTWCQIWIVTSILLLMLKSITVIVHLITGNHDHDAISYGLLIDSIFRFYEIFVVIAFMIKERHEEGEGPVLLYNKAEVEPA